MRTFLLGPALIALALPATAVAQETSSDRADLDVSAGRALFQNTPIAESIVPGRGQPAGNAAPPEPGPAPAADRQRRTIRVVYPAPYGR